MCWHLNTLHNLEGSFCKCDHPWTVQLGRSTFSCRMRWIHFYRYRCRKMFRLCRNHNSPDIWNTIYPWNMILLCIGIPFPRNQNGYFLHIVHKNYHPCTSSNSEHMACITQFFHHRKPHPYTRGCIFPSNPTWMPCHTFNISSNNHHTLHNSPDNHRT